MVVKWKVGLASMISPKYSTWTGNAIYLWGLWVESESALNLRARPIILVKVSLHLLVIYATVTISIFAPCLRLIPFSPVTHPLAHAG